VTEGTILRWLRQDGDHVKSGEAVVEIETDKANVEVPAENSGVLRIYVASGNTVPVGTTIATIHGSAPAAAQVSDTDASVWPPPPTALIPRRPVPKTSLVSSVVLVSFSGFIAVQNSVEEYRKTGRAWHLIPAAFLISVFLWRAWLSFLKR
jgi:pyruvate/2-oxoglutarate dehydrogenase complex dihydrolipoamide acyltransferase (E2) component